MMEYSDFLAVYTAYAESFRQPDGTLSEPMQQKLDHTLEVVEFADRIASAQKADPREFLLCKLAALFHDTARFRQLQLYHTFDDGASKFDHGHEGVRILLEKNMLAGLPPSEACAVITAVELHNKPRVDFSQLGGIFSAPAKNVRDADKLSILKLLTAYITGELQFEDSSVFLLKCTDSEEFTPEILDAVLNGKAALYQYLHTVNDFKLSLFAWCGDYNYPETARIILEYGFYDRIRKTMPDQPVVDLIYQKAMDQLKCLSSKSKI